jgi:hypothetical protein
MQRREDEKIYDPEAWRGVEKGKREISVETLERGNVEREIQEPGNVDTWSARERGACSACLLWWPWLY